MEEVERGVMGILYRCVSMVFLSVAAIVALVVYHGSFSNVSNRAVGQAEGDSPPSARGLSPFSPAALKDSVAKVDGRKGGP